MFDCFLHSRYSSLIFGEIAHDRSIVSSLFSAHSDKVNVIYLVSNCVGYQTHFGNTYLCFMLVKYCDIPSFLEILFEFRIFSGRCFRKYPPQHPRKEMTEEKDCIL